MMIVITQIADTQSALNSVALSPESYHHHLTAALHLHAPPKRQSEIFRKKQENMNFIAPFQVINRQE
ncbi:hypothetical protein [Peribacillus frigoritolerans]|uniref:hypothetical protein n=1 Tax=Peribacillus frigoritolerans TaxID=450367 RepID=UPI00203FB444|nr:hypothetical protein [Peribacillus frigoritolerans]